MMKKNGWAGYYWLVLLSVVFIAGCGDAIPKSVDGETDTKGTFHISVDESFKPVIDEQIKVFEGSFPDVKIIPHYKPEAECIKDLLKDSATRMVIVTRGLSDKEARYFDDSLNYVPRSEKIATDAIAIIVNINSKDTLFSFDRLQKQLTGKQGSQQKIIFDGLNATSGIRFAIDSILNGKSFDTSVVKGAQNSQEVIDLVAANENYIGMVGISWIGNPEDSAQVQMLKKVKMVYVRCDRCKDTPYISPNQYQILTNQYPLVRGLFYILKENYRGPGTGFAAFMQYERGQLIFKRAYLGSKMGFGIRSVKINEKLP